MGRKLLILNERDRCHPWAGGSELNISETGKRFAALGYEPVLLCTRCRGAAAEEMQDGMRVRRFGNRLTYYLTLPFVVRQEVKAPGTVIVEHLNKLPFCTPVYTRAPVLLLTHHLFGATAFRQVPFPVACVVYLAEKLIPFVYRGRRFIAVSESTRDDLVARGIPPSAITVVPNGLDTDHYHDRGRAPDARPTVLVLGRVEFYKRIEFVFRALQRLLPALPDAQVLVVGSGGALESLKRQAEELGVSRHVTFTGFVSESEKLAHVRRAHVVVNTSDKEGWGLTVLEANACGVPVVASDVPGLRDAVRHEESGLLVPHGDIPRLAAAVQRILQDAEYRRRLSAGARAWALHFSWDRSSADIAAVIESLDPSTRGQPVPPVIDARRSAGGSS